MLSDDMSGDISQQVANNSNGSSQARPEKLAKLEARMKGISPPQTFRTNVGSQSVRQNRISPSTAIRGMPSANVPTSSSDSDDEVADFSIQPSLKKRRMFMNDGDNMAMETEDSGPWGRGQKGSNGAATTGQAPPSTRRSVRDGSTQPVAQGPGAPAGNGNATAGSARVQRGGPGGSYSRKAHEASIQQRVPAGEASVGHMACQTDDGMSAAERQWRKERQQMQEELEAARQRVTHLEAEVERFQQEATQAEVARAQAEKELKALRERDQQRLHVVSEVLLENAKWQRQEARASMRRETVRYGNLSTERTGTMVREVWEEGQVYYEIQAKLSELLQQKEGVEKKRKLLKKQHADRAEATDGEKASGASEEEYLMKDEMCKSRLATLKREEEALLHDRQRYEVDKAGHIRELKRLRDEDSSRFNKFQILNKRYALLNLLGKGGFSEVYKAFDLAEFCWVACKLHQLAPSWSEAKKRDYVRHALREYDIQRMLHHANIVRLRDIFEIDANTFCTVLDYCQGKDLDAVLKATPILPEREARSIAAQVMAGLLYLNRPDHPRIIHYDLKPANILFDALGEVKITDFGLSKVMEEEAGSLGMELTSQGAGTYWYLPPECFNTHEKPLISCKVDVWSLGVMVYQMLFGRRPFGHDQSQQSILHHDTIVNARTVTFPPRPAVSPEAKEFIKRCLTYDQRKRPDVATVAQEPFLSFTKRKQ